MKLLGVGGASTSLRLTNSRLLMLIFTLYLSNFLSFLTLKNEIFVKDFLTTMQARMLIFGMQVVTTCSIVGLRNSLLPLIFSVFVQFLLHLSVLTFFRPSSFFVKHFVKDFSTTMQARMLIFVCRLITTSYIVGLRISLLLLILP